MAVEILDHIYTAEASVLQAHIITPIDQVITPQSFIALPDTGGYHSQQSKQFHLGKVISIESSYTQVAGNRETKPGHGWSTLVTSVAEGLNILDVVTADRIVAQVSTEHPLDGHVPSITFLGTRFENLRIAGHKVELDLCLDLFGDRPGDDSPYTRNPDFLKRVSSQYAGVRKHENPIASIFGLGSYDRDPENLVNVEGDKEAIECSLVNQAQGAYPGGSFGHVIQIPDFGTLYLATLHLEHSECHPKTRVPKKTTVSLNMLHAKMGCIANGSATVITTKTNGHGMPTGGG
jgi:hypothetical protein